MNIVDFLKENYIYVIIVIVLTIITIIGFLADKKKGGNKKVGTMSGTIPNNQNGTAPVMNGMPQANMGGVNNYQQYGMPVNNAQPMPNNYNQQPMPVGGMAYPNNEQASIAPEANQSMPNNMQYNTQQVPNTQMMNGTMGPEPMNQMPMGTNQPEMPNQNMNTVPEPMTYNNQINNPQMVNQPVYGSDNITPSFANNQAPVVNSQSMEGIPSQIPVNPNQTVPPQPMPNYGANIPPQPVPNVPVEPSPMGPASQPASGTIPSGQINFVYGQQPQQNNNGQYM